MRWDDGSPISTVDQLKLWLTIAAATPIVVFIVWIWLTLILLPGD